MALQSLSSIRVELQALQQKRETLCSGQPRFLFRGQSLVYPRVNSVFARIDINNRNQIEQAYTTFRWAKHICGGLRGYKISSLNGMAVLQHYGWPTPLIDLTGTVEVAVYFALSGARVGQTAVIYKLDCVAIPVETIIVDHDFLTHETDDGGLRSRWLKQDGFAIVPKNWIDPEGRQFDLLSCEFAKSLTAYEFTVKAEDQANIANFYSIQDDPIPQQLQQLLRLYCQETFKNGLDNCLRAKIDAMFP